MEIMVSVAILAIAGMSFILQIIVLAIVARNKKDIAAAMEAAAKARDQRSADRPFDRRPPQPQQPRDAQRGPRPAQQPQQHQAPAPQQPPQQPAASVDRSLRDINLRLKNAEQDQERARRRMDLPPDQGIREAREGGRAYDGHPRDRDRDRDRGRAARGRGEFRGGSGRRDFRQNGGPGGQPRSFDQQPSQSAPAPAPAAAPANEPVVIPAEPKPAAVETPVVPVVQQTSLAGPVQSAEVESTGIQHDRRIQRRRPADVFGGAGTAEAEKPAGQESAETAASQPIVFGRR